MTTTKARETTHAASGQDGRRVLAGESGPAPAPGDRRAAPDEPAQRPHSWGPPLDASGRPRRMWREEVLTRADELTTYAVAMDDAVDPAAPRSAAVRSNSALDACIAQHLTNACDAARGVSFWRAARGARMERAFAEIDAAQAALLYRAPNSYVLGQLPSIATFVRAHLTPSNPERVHAERVADELTLAVTTVSPASGLPAALRADNARTSGTTTSGATTTGARATGATLSGATASGIRAGGSAARTGVLLPRDLGVAAPPVVSEPDRVSLIQAVLSAGAAARREHSRLRSFRNIVIMTTVAMLVLAGGLAFLGARQPSWIPVCFAPQGLQSVVCPTTTSALPDDPDTHAPPTGSATADKIAETAQPHDIFLVMLVGLAAAAVTGAAALRHVRGTSTPFAVPVALVALKLPTGALTALLGLLLIQGGFVPGLSALDSSGQILAWALIFGAAQQLVTGLVDKKAQSVLDSVGSTPMTAEKE